ncbi:MAG: DUF92 domain-containing protein [Candidatus Thalassarchaeaceae archaeon]|nr:DUF92 domain-containing protein [Candidatus Thalassarchaeaceae archaeon]
MIELEMTGGLQQTNLIISIILVLLLMVISRLRRVLNESGTWAAAVLGLGVAIAGHWSWLMILLAFLTSGFVATKWKYAEKKSRGFNEGKEGERDWTNVLANGGVPLFISLLALYTQNWQDLLPIFSASVAVAASDTFASEFGCLDHRVRMITTFKRCKPGVNGGFSPSGQLAAFVGSGFIALFSAALGTILDAEALSQPVHFIIGVTVIGFIGCQIDSVLGAVLENRGYIGKGTVNSLAITSGAIIAWFLLPIMSN